MSTTFSSKANLAQSSLANGILDSDLSLTVAAGDGARFPATGTFHAVLWDAQYSTAAEDESAEIITCTLDAGDTFDVARGQEGTTAKLWPSGTHIANVLTEAQTSAYETAINTLEDSLDAAEQTLANLQATGTPDRAKWEYNNPLSIIINPAVYRHSGTTEQLVFWDAPLYFQCRNGGSYGSNTASVDTALLAAGIIMYLSLDDSAIVTLGINEITDAEFVAHIDAPVWDDVRKGWYRTSTNSDDRTVFAVMMSGASSVAEFYHEGDYMHLVDVVAINSAMVLTSSWAASNALKLPAFTDAAQCSFEWIYVDTSTSMSWRPKGASSTTGARAGHVDINNQRNYNTVLVVAGADDKLDLKCATTGNNELYLYQHGWYLGRGV